MCELVEGSALVVVVLVVLKLVLFVVTGDTGEWLCAVDAGEAGTSSIIVRLGSFGTAAEALI